MPSWFWSLAHECKAEVAGNGDGYWFEWFVGELIKEKISDVE